MVRFLVRTSVSHELLAYLESVANLHYLLDYYVVNPDRSRN
jgi:hypothetical protein